jgi:hypothetical protein
MIGPITPILRGAEIWRGSGDPALAELGERLAAAIAGGGDQPIEQALGLTGNWRIILARERRDRLVCELAGRYYHHETKRGRAASVAAGLRQYAVHWPREGRQPTSPHDADSRLDLCWRIFRQQEIVAPGRVPRPRTIREILTARSTG